MRSEQEKQATRDANLNNKIGYCEAIAKLQERLKGVYKIMKANPDDNMVQAYQEGRETELRYSITILLTPKQRVAYAKAKNQKRYLLMAKLANVKSRI